MFHIFLRVTQHLNLLQYYCAQIMVTEGWWWCGGAKRYTLWKNVIFLENVLINNTIIGIKYSQRFHGHRQIISSRKMTLRIISLQYFIPVSYGLGRFSNDISVLEFADTLQEISNYLISFGVNFKQGKLCQERK